MRRTPWPTGLLPPLANGTGYGALLTENCTLFTSGNSVNV
jgi:hypothetical protein